MIAYLSGPMTGLPNHNFDMFNGAATVLRTQGYAVINPADNYGGDCSLPRSTYMTTDLAHVLVSDIVFVLPGWQGAIGARTEVQNAFQCGKRVYVYAAGKKKGGYIEIFPFDLTDSTLVRHEVFEQGENRQRVFT